LYKLVAKGNGKMDKLPCDHRTCDVFVKGMDWQRDPSAWTTAENAIALVSQLGNQFGVGFLFTESDPFWFVDADNCLMPDGEWSPVAIDLGQRLSGAAIEVSQSGKGLHIFGSGVVPRHACKNIAAGLELYTESRFVALTGERTVGSASFNVAAAMTPLVDHYFPPKVTMRGDEWTTEPTNEYTSPGDNDVLIQKAINAGSAASKFGNKASFADLWTKNTPVLADCYAPDASSHDEYDGSSADAALAQHLAFWTGCNCEHMLNLMWCSGLVRDKWARDDYLTRTITNAISLQSVVYTAGRVSVEPVAPLVSNEPSITTGYQFLAAQQQVEHFAKCVYIQDMHKVFTPTGALLNESRFNATYGGYVFQLDGEASGKITKKAWEAFTESQVIRYPKAASTCFRPDLEPGELVEDEGRYMVNVYVPVETPRMTGDITPFLTHLAKLIPDTHDRLIILSYMAALIQYKGVKFQWTPLIQGTEGNGKTLLTRCVAFAIGRQYTHMPKANDIDNKFNGWILNKLFIGVEDIYVPDHKREVVEALKPMITNTELEIQLKGVDQITKTVCANFILNMNDKAGFKKTQNDRRFCMFYTAQQCVSDTVRDGMGGNYFPDLYNWLKSGGYAMVADYLDRYDIPKELNPAGQCHRAPMTTSTLEAVANSLGGIEQELQEAIDEDRPGFAGGWVSSMAFDKMLQNLNAARRIPPNKRRELIQSLGYDWHPSLKRGRVNNFVLFDQGKPRLFIKDGHIHTNLSGSGEVARKYQEAQMSSIAAGNTAKLSDER
jgi:hypothetical protein